MMLHKIFGRTLLGPLGGRRPRRRKAKDMRPNPGDMMANISDRNIHLTVYVICSGWGDKTSMWCPNPHETETVTKMLFMIAKTCAATAVDD